MDSNFNQSLVFVLQSEGGWSDNPADPGGATMKGVTLAVFRNLIDPDATKTVLRNITDAQLNTVYHKSYWNVIRGDELPSGVDYAVFDFAVNSGPGRAAKYLQSVVGANADGSIGPATLAAVAKIAPATIINHLMDQRLAFLQRLDGWSTFGRGWSDRVATVRARALKMAGA